MTTHPYRVLNDLRDAVSSQHLTLIMATLFRMQGDNELYHGKYPADNSI
jgi:hypothetical protein